MVNNLSQYKAIQYNKHSQYNEMSRSGYVWFINSMANSLQISKDLSPTKFSIIPYIYKT